MHDLVRLEREAPKAQALSVEPPEAPGVRRWALAAVNDGRKLASAVVLLLVAVLGTIKAYKEPWSTVLTPLLLAAPYAFAAGLGALATGPRRRALDAGGARPRHRALGPGREGPRASHSPAGGERPHFAQMAGMACAACRDKIIVDSEALPCPLCRRPCHAPCARVHFAEHKSLGASHPYR